MACLIPVVLALLWSQEGGHEHMQHPAPGVEQRHGSAQHGPQAPPSTPEGALLDLERARNASGSAWEPESRPHGALHRSVGAWDLMFHSLLFGGYDYQGSDRGSDAPIVLGWVMGMAERRFASSTVTGRLMLSPEPWTVRDGGYPLLLQTGETYNDEPLRDRQHPHDFVMEVGAVYTHAVADGVALQGYAAAAGEPALGPVAFPHRGSAAPDPLAALGHHWQDATHISFGVLTAGIVTRYAKLEGSWFNGREPDETRWDFDLRAPDSYAVRLSVAPAASTTGQVSYGYLSSAESLQPEVSAHRVTASLSHYVGRPGETQLLTTAVYGLNREEGEDVSSSGLLEAALLFGANEIFGRGELIQKSGHDLVLTDELEEETFWLGALALGYLRNIAEIGGWLPGVGARAAANIVPEGLRDVYGSRVLYGGMVYARLTVAPMRHGAH